MSDVQITLTLPEDLAERARVAGLLNSERLASWLEHQLELDRQKHIQKLLYIANQLSQVAPQLTIEEIEAEIEAGRQAHYESQHK